MIQVNKAMYYALAAICLIFAAGVVISKLVTKQSFDFATDGMLLLTTVAGWLFASNKDDSKKNDESKDDSNNKEKGDVAGKDNEDEQNK